VAGGAAAVARAEPTLAPDAADDLLTIASFLRRPPPELELIRLPRKNSGRCRRLCVHEVLVDSAPSV